MARDRVLASKLGVAAVDALVKGRYGVVIGEKKGEITYTPFKETFEKKKKLDPDLIRALRVLSK
jgi:6-phosphofructokinase 1